jgi:iron complex transport system substrate-binding protein
MGGLVALAVLVAGVAACGSGGDDPGDDPGDESDGAGSGDGDAFPVEIEHTHGTTTLDRPPERVVTVGLTDHDAVLALGVVPVGVTDWFGDHPHATWPWAQDELEALGGDGPEIVGDTTGIDFERVAALRPDVVLGLYSGLTEDDYETLSAIAPTVAQPGEHPDHGIPWQEQTRTIGRALGRDDAADELVAGVEARFAEARDAHPGFEGASAVVASPYEGTVAVFAPEDPRGRFLDSLGFVPVDEISELTAGSFSADLSLERVDLLDVDALVWILDDWEPDLAQLHEEELYRRLDVVAEGREVPVENLGLLGGATTFQTVLSLPSLIDGLVPMLAAAVDGDPATPVEPPA